MLGGEQARLGILCAGLLLGASSCSFTNAHVQCHQRALEQLGCCPFHGEDCEGASVDRIREDCAEELAEWTGGTDEEGGASEDGAETSTTTDEPETTFGVE